jgi:hypothetical protein
MEQSHLWNKKQQTNMKIFCEGEKEAIKSLMPKVIKLKEKKDVIDAARVLSNGWTKVACAQEFFCDYGIPMVLCFLFLFAFVSLGSYEEAVGRWSRNATNATNATNTQFPGINKWSNSYSFGILEASLVLICLIILYMFCSIPLLVGPRCRCRKMMYYCCSMGPLKTCQAIRFASSAEYPESDNLPMVGLFFCTFILGPFMLILRSYTWGSMSENDQITNGGKPEEHLFPVWPFFIFPCIAIPGMIVYFISLSGWNLDYDHCPEYAAIVYFILLLLSSGSLILWSMKFDHSAIVESMTGLECSIPLFIAISGCLCSPPIHAGISRCRLNETNYTFAGLILSVCILLLPIIMFVLFTVQYDYFVPIGLWVYFAVVCIYSFLMVCCLLCLLSIGGWGDS